MAVSTDEDLARATNELDRRPAAGRRRDVNGLGKEVGVVAALTVVVYLATRSAVPALTHDSLTYLLAIEEGGEGLFHPHHLGFNALARVWLDTWRAVGLGGDPLLAIEALNAVLGAAAASLVWLLLRVRAQLDWRAAAIGTAGACVSYGFWYYSVSLEVYMLSLVLLLATFYALTSAVRSPTALVAIGALNGLAVVAHQINVLFGIVVVTELARRVDRATALRRIATYGAAAGGVVVGAYAAVLAFVVRPESTQGATDWFTRYAQNSGNWSVAPATPVKAATGFARSLVGGQFAYRLDAVHDRVVSAFADKSLEDEAFLVRNLSPAISVALICLTVAGGVLLIGTVISGWRVRHEIREPGRSMLRPLTIWLVTYAAFFVVWDPMNPEFWIPQTTILWIVAAIAIGPRRPAAHTRPAGAMRPTLLAVAVVAIACANGLGTVLPAIDEGNDIYAVRYEALDGEVAAGDLVVVDHPHLGVGYAARLTDASPVTVTGFDVVVTPEDRPDPRPTDVADDLARALSNGHRVAVDAHLVDQPSSAVARRAGDELEERFGSTWRLLTVPGASGWYVIDPSASSTSS